MALPAPAPDRTAIVTGASSGIGAELARGLASKGFGVTLIARREDRLQSLAGELRSAHDIRAEVVAADMTDESAREGLVKEMADRGLTVDILVNNAGFSTTGPVYKADVSRELALVRTDVEAVVHLCTLFLPAMVERGQGAVLNVASTAAFQPLPGQAAYGAAKAFVLSYGRAAGAELRGKGVTLTTLCPGPVETEFAQAAGFDPNDAESALPKFMWVPAAEVAKAALEGLAKGKPVVIPGMSNRMAAGFAQVTPRSILLPMLAKQHPALKEG
jgi:short-subunit dehydrogenase